MKNIIHNCKLLSTIFLFCVTGMANAQAFFTVDELVYIVNSDGTSVTVNGFDSSSPATGTLVIPSTVSYQGNTYTVTVIRSYAFLYCENLTGDLTIPNTVQSIEEGAFMGCSGFTGTLTLGSSLTMISDYAFERSNNFADIVCFAKIPPILGIGVFNNWDKSNTIVNVPYGIVNKYDQISWGGFSHFEALAEKTENLIYTLNDDGETVTLYGHNAGTNASGVLHIVDSVYYRNAYRHVVAIRDYAFSNCTGLSGNLTLPQTLDTIGHHAFYGCSGLNGNLTIPNSVTTIGAYAFGYCSGFSGLTLGQSLTTIKSEAFFNCTSFGGDLTIPHAVTTIENSAFKGCLSFTAITSRASIPPTLEGAPFDGWNATLSVTVPCGSRAAYRSINWGGFSNIISDCSNNNTVHAQYYPNPDDPHSPYTTVYWDEELADDFETGDFSKLDWQMSPLYPWVICDTVSHSGTYCMVSGNRGINNTSSSIEVTLNIPKDDTISFYAKISCEKDWDIGYFYIDGVKKESWTDTLDWMKYQYPVTAGQHTFLWKYEKDNKGQEGDDCLYIDDIVFYRMTPPTVPFDPSAAFSTNRFDVYRANDNDSIPTLLAEGYNSRYFIDSTWSSLEPGPYKYGIAISDGNNRGGEILLEGGKPSQKSEYGEWLHYDNGAYETSVGAGGTTYWASIPPPNLLTPYYDGTLTKVALHTTYSGTATLNVYVGGTQPNGTPAATQSFIMTGNEDWMEIVLNNPVTIDISQNLWISFHVDNITYPVDACQDTGDPNNRWVSIDGTNWIDLGYAGLPGLGWMIRGYIVLGEEISTIVWSNSIEKPISIYEVTATARPSIGGTVSGAGTYHRDSIATLTATPAVGYDFVHWTLDDVEVSTDSVYSFTVTDDVHYVAIFSPCLTFAIATHHPDPEDLYSPEVMVYWGNQIVEDFETGDFSQFGWKNDPNYPWTITTNNPYEGSYCMKSGGAGVGNMSSDMTVTLTIPADGILSFFGKISSEGYWDYGYFYIDGVQKGSYTGNGNWDEKKFNITQGTHTFKWQYTKDSNTDSYDDCFYVDYITFYKNPEPAQPGWHTYCESEFNNAVGSNVSDTPSWAYEYPAEFLHTNYAGWQITKVSLFSDNMYNAVGGNYTCRIYVGGNEPAAGTMVSTITVDVPSNQNAWVDWDLTTPVNVTGNETIWVVWTANTHTSSWPAGCSGNLNDLGTWWNGGNGWEHLTYGTWTMKQYFTDQRGRSVAVRAVPNHIFNVYRSNADSTNVTLIAENLTGPSYIDTTWQLLDYGSYLYGVSAVGDSASIQWTNPIDRLERMYAPENLYVSRTGWATWEGQREYVVTEWTLTDMNDSIIAADTTQEFFVQLPTATLVDSTLYKLKVRNHYLTGTSPEAVCEWYYVSCEHLEGFSEITGIVSPEGVNLNWTYPETRNDRTVTQDEGWYYYDNGSFKTNIAFMKPVYWGIMIPAGSYKGNAVTKVSQLDNRALNGTVTIYNDGDTAPANPVGSKNITSTRSWQFVDYEFEEPVYIDPSKNLWIVFHTEDSLYNIPVSLNNTDDNGRWWSEDGVSWNGLSGAFPTWGNYTWMIRAFVISASVGDPLSVSLFRDGEWLGFLNGNSYYDAQGTPNTQYEARVVYNGDTLCPYNNTYMSMSCLQTVPLVGQDYTITATANPTAGGTIEGGGTHHYGDTCTLVATTSTGFHFLNWTVNGTQVSTSQTLSFTVTQDSTFIANFELDSHEIIALSNNTDEGTVTGGGNYSYGDTCTLVATPSTGHHFLNWTVNGIQVSTSQTLSFTVTQDSTFVANFAINNHVITALSSNTDEGTVTGGGNYNYGDTCTLVATPATGYAFLYWRKDGSTISTDDNYSFVVTADGTYYGYFRLQRYTVNAWVNPDSTGTVYGTGIYDYGTTATLTAVPATGYKFLNWTDNDSVVSSSASYSVVVTTTVSLVANFGLMDYDITAEANPTAGGSVSGIGAYHHFDPCTLTATPSTGYHFVNWTLDGSVVGTSPSHSFTVTGDAHYVANFELNSYEITAAANPLDGGAVEGAGTYEHFSACTLTATPATGYHFVNWTLNGSVVGTSETYSFTVTGAAHYVANFALNGYEITAAADPLDGGSVEGTGSYEHFSTCTLTATPSTGYHFLNWTLDGSVVGTSETYSFTVTGPAHYVAHFSLNSYEITASVNPSVGGSVDGAGSYEHFSNCTLTATPSTGYHFVSWTLDGSVVGTSETYSFTVTGTAHYTANFEINTYGITAVADPLDGGNIEGTGTYEHFSTCTLTAVPATGYHFVSWTLDGVVVGTSLSYQFEVSGPVSIVANFETNTYQIIAVTSDPEQGSVTGGGTYSHFDTCTLTATPATGHHFLYWRSDGTNVSTSPTYSFMVTGDAAFAGFFDVNRYTVSAAASPAYAGNVTGGGLYEHGSTCTLTASANPGFAFLNWTLDGAVVSSSESLSFTVTAQCTYTANFTTGTFDISVAASPEQGGTVSGGGTYPNGATATLEASANSHYRFVSWTLDGNVVSGSPSYTFTVTANGHYVANFEELPQYAIAVDEVEGVTITVPASAYAGDLVTVVTECDSLHRLVSLFYYTDDPASVTPISLFTKQFVMPGANVTIGGESLLANKGDANLDGLVNILDVIVTINYICGNDPQPFSFENADMDSDNVIDISDAFAINALIHSLKGLGGLSAEQLEVLLSDLRDGCGDLDALYDVVDGKLYVESTVALAGFQFTLSAKPTVLGLPGFSAVGNWRDGGYVLCLFNLDNGLEPGQHAVLDLNGGQVADALGATLQGCKVWMEKGTLGVNVLDERTYSVYPVPARDQLTVEGPGIVSVEVFNAMGQLVKRISDINADRSVITVSDLASGSYLLRIGTESGVVVKSVSVAR